MSPILVFAAWFVAAEAALTAAQIPLRKKEFKTLPRILLIVLKALLGIAFGVLPLAGPVQLRFAQPFMMALYVALLADAFADAVCCVVFAVRNDKRRFGVVKAVSIACGVLFFAYGAVNMQIVTPEYHSFTSDKVTRLHTVVFLADLHVGSAQSFSVTRKTVEDVKAVGADAVILCGDIIDDYTSKEEMENACALFDDFGSPVFFIYGNHDRQGHAEYAGGRKFTPEELERALTENGVTILRDGFAQIDSELELLGREDLSEREGRADISSLTDPSPESYLIVADHQPSAFKEHAAFGADLQLSGHTHAGQLFPLGLFYGLFSYGYGEYTEGDSVLIVSAGACGWRMPLRTDAHCRYDVVTITPD